MDKIDASGAHELAMTVVFDRIRMKYSLCTGYYCQCLRGAEKIIIGFDSYRDGWF